LASLPESLSRLSRLQHLSLNHCWGMIVCPEVVGQLLGLTWLDLSDNIFMQLPESLGGLSRLRRLDVSDCHYLLSLPTGLSCMTQLLKVRDSLEVWSRDASNVLKQRCKYFTGRTGKASCAITM
jgi:Leucine-rich repeat (LRR) protein